MKIVYKYIVWLLMCMSFTVFADAQSYERYANSLRIQYGVFQYNSNKNEFLNEDNQNFLSAGITYRRQLGRISGLNLSGKYYQWKLKDSSELNSYAAQLMWVLHAGHISKNRKLNRLTPYAGFGLGIQQHNLSKANGFDSSFNKLYIPFEVGILYNISSRWSLGVFGEYKLSTSSDIKNISKTSEGKMDLVNAAGAVLVWHFGKKTRRKTYSPVIYTNPTPEAVTETKVLAADSAVIVKKIIIKKIDTVKNIPPKEKPKQLKDSVNKLIAIPLDSTRSVPDTILQKKKTVTKIEKDKAGDSTIKKTDTLLQKRKKTVVEKSKKAVKQDAAKPGTDSIKSKVREIKPIKLVASDSSSSKTKTAVKDTVAKPTAKTPVINKAVIEKKDTNAAGKADEIEAKRNILVQRNNEKNDSLNARVNELNDRITILQKEIEERPAGEKEKIILQPIEVKNTDEASISNLKNAYNQLNDKIETNYKKGVLKEVEFEKMKAESEKLKNTISLLTEENEIAFEELEVVFNAISDLQVDLNLEKEKRNYAPVENASDNNANLQRQLDSVLVELKKLKQNQPQPKQGIAEKNEKVPVKKVTKADAVKLPERKEDEKNADTYTRPELKRDKDVIELGTSLEVYTILFDLNSSAINPLYTKELIRALNNIKVGKNAYFLLSGYTDKSGNIALNKKLSQNRIKAVKRALINAGVSAGMIKEDNVGSDEATGFVKQNDRKVIVQIINN